MAHPRQRGLALTEEPLTRGAAPTSRTPLTEATAVVREELGCPLPSRLSSADGPWSWPAGASSRSPRFHQPWDRGVLPAAGDGADRGGRDGSATGWPATNAASSLSCAGAAGCSRWRSRSSSQPAPTSPWGLSAQIEVPGGPRACRQRSVPVATACRVLRTRLN